VLGPFPGPSVCSWRSRLARRLAKPALAGLVLAALNLWIFRDTYAGRSMFPWDFRDTYHAIPFYWHAIVANGHFPEWIAHQSIGYPAQMGTPGALYYPPLWLFVVFKILFTMRTAAEFQCLHVLAGALGMVWLSRVRGLSWAAATLAGCAYHLFGGFYSNAEHMDIVRAYALLPFLLAGLTLDEGRPWQRPPARFWAVPFVVLCVGTGSYPGQLPPVFTCAFLYLVVQVFEGQPYGRRRRAKLACAFLAMFGLGLMLALPSFGPSLLIKNELDRATERMVPHGIDLDLLFTTLFPYEARTLSSDVSMRSFFVTLPVLLGVFFVPWTAVRRQRALVAVFLVAALMIPAGRVYEAVIRWLPVFGYSRFPIADFRGLVAVPFVLMGAQGIERLLAVTRRFSWLDGVRGAALVGFLALGAERFRWRKMPSAQIRDIALILAALVAVCLLARVRRLPRGALMAGISLLAALDGNRMHSLVTVTWKSPPNNYSYVTDRRELDRSIREPPTARPAREQGGWSFTRRYPPNLTGYLRGRWVADDYGPGDHLRVVIAVRKDPSIAQYVYGASQPKLLAAAQALPPAQVAARPVSPVSGTATPTLYTAEKVVYDIIAPDASILTENEPSFPGWRGFIHCDQPGSRSEVAPVRELWPLRAWRIPAGHYRFCAVFRLPGLRLSLVIAGLALLLWLGAGIGFTLHARRQHRQRLALWRLDGRLPPCSCEQPPPRPAGGA
jgi:hypothetical protein